jgi:hypothetical protein
VTPTPLRDTPDRVIDCPQALSTAVHKVVDKYLQFFAGLASPSATIGTPQPSALDPDKLPASKLPASRLLGSSLPTSNN